MDLSRYLDLYLAETRERLRSLNRGLLELEAGGAAGALEEAFRSAHTIKGMSATMGFRAVAAVAHELEDRLEELRSGGRQLDTALIDALLARADELERAVEEAVLSAPVLPAEPIAAAEEAGELLDTKLTAAQAAEAETHALLGTVEVVARVVLQPAVALKAARALVVCRRTGEVARVLGTDPPEFSPDFGGELRIFLGRGTDRLAVERAIRGAGEVQSVVFESPAAVRKEAVQAELATRLEPRHVRVDQRRLDELVDGIGELSILRGRLGPLLEARRLDQLEELVGRMDRLVDELQDAALALRMVPVAEVFDRFPRVVRDTARGLGKEVDFLIEGREIELDRAILEELADPLVHLLRNAVDHGLETAGERSAAGKPVRGRLRLGAARERSGVVIEVEDDGRGVRREGALAQGRALGLLAAARLEGVGAADLTDEQLLRLLSQPGYSSATAVSEFSGRGVGLDVVMSRVRSLGGAIELRTSESGTTFALRLPLTLAVAPALRVKVGDEDYAIPLTHIAEAVELKDDMIAWVRGQEVLRLRDQIIPLVRLRRVLRVGEPGGESAAVVAEAGEDRAALAVDRLVGREEIVVKPFDPAVDTLPVFSGATLLADGRPALVLDPMSVL
ncbi:MAG: chemotaxis protein CheA [Gemmatimonadetes bacterium]|nr:chemotaxis protein CheA [Gemmatimonadota bacterium]